MYRNLGFIIRNSKFFKKTETLILLYNAFVRPHLEYASIIWSPQAESNIDLIEKVQKRFLRFLYVKKFNVYPYLISYNTMLGLFKAQRLSIKRNLYSALFIYLVVNNIRYKDCFLINYIKLLPKIH